MKRYILMLVFLVFFVMFCSSGLEAKKPMNLYIAGGVLTDDSFSFDPFLWQAGLQLDIHLGDALMLSPEGFVIVHKFEFDPIIIAPACLLNFKVSSFFVGGGLTKWFIVGEDMNFSTDLALKVNAGFRGDNFRLTAFIITDFDELFKKDYMSVGATLGISF